MLKVGLTGGIGSGKTTIAGIFNLLGVPVFNADIEAKKLMISDPIIKSEIIALLGDDAYTEDLLNKEYIAELIFKDEGLLKGMNSIVHSAVHKHFTTWAELFTEKPYILYEAAILFESGASRYFDYIILVTAPESLRIERVMKRDKVNKEQVKLRIKNQFTEDDKMIQSDFKIYNDSDLLVLPQILGLHEKLISLQRRN